jgi:hypothetical protein
MRPYNRRTNGNGTPANPPKGPVAPVPRREGNANRRVYNIDVEAIHPEHGIVHVSSSGYSIMHAMNRITAMHGIPPENVLRVRGTSPGKKS